MTAAPICITCNVERTLIGTKPVRNRHDMLQYECPHCRNIFRLVMQRAPLDLDDLVFHEPALQAASR
jgi:hypothetical protein